MDSAKITEYVRLYKLAAVAVSDENLVPIRTDEEIKKEELISAAYWLGFRDKGITKEAFENSDSPNVWISLGKHIHIGLHFNTIAAVRNARNLLLLHNSKQREELLSRLKDLDNSYKTVLKIKTKDRIWTQTPIYSDADNFVTNTIDEQKIGEIFRRATEIESEGKIKRDLGEVDSEFPSIDLLYIEIPKTDADFTNRIKEVFEVYRIVRNIKSEKVHNMEIKLKAREEQRLKEQIMKVEIEKKSRAEIKRAEDLNRNIQELNKMNITPEQYRERNEKWFKEHPIDMYLEP